MQIYTKDQIFMLRTSTSYCFGADLDCSGLHKSTLRASFLLSPIRFFLFNGLKLIKSIPQALYYQINIKCATLIWEIRVKWPVNWEFGYEQKMLCTFALTDVVLWLQGEETK